MHLSMYLHHCNAAAVVLLLFDFTLAKKPLKRDFFASVTDTTGCRDSRLRHISTYLKSSKRVDDKAAAWSYILWLHAFIVLCFSSHLLLQMLLYVQDTAVLNVVNLTAVKIVAPVKRLQTKTRVNIDSVGW